MDINTILNMNSHRKSADPSRDYIKHITDDIKLCISHYESWVRNNNPTHIYIPEVWDIITQYYTEDARCIELLMRCSDWILNWDTRTCFNIKHFHSYGATHMCACLYRAPGINSKTDLGCVPVTGKTYWVLQDREAFETLLMLPNAAESQNILAVNKICQDDLSFLNVIRSKMYYILYGWLGMRKN